MKKIATNESHLIHSSKEKSLSVYQEERKLQIDYKMLVLNNLVQNPKRTLDIKKIVFQNFALSPPMSFSRLTYLFSKYADSKLLSRNCNSTFWLERYAIAQNTQTSIKTLKFLAKDANRIVRAAAKANLENR